MGNDGGTVLRNAFGIYVKSDMHEATEELRRFYVSFTNRTTGNVTADHLATLMSLARRLYVDNLDFWRHQRKSPYIYGQNLAFMDSTLDFIGGADRDVSIVNWSHLLCWDETKEPRPNLSKREKEFALSRGGMAPPLTLLEAWLQRPNGFNDMLCSLYILFCGKPF